MNEYNYGDSVKDAYEFFYKNFCDVYVEAVKPIMYGKDDSQRHASKNVLYTCIDRGLKLLHPMMPFITEELYQRLPHPDFNKSESICIAPFPTDDHFINNEIEEKAELLFDIVHKINATQTQFNLKGKKPRICLYSKDKSLTEFFYNQSLFIVSLTNGGQLSVTNDKDDKSIKGWFVNVVNATTDVYLDITVDNSKEVNY